MWSYLWDSLLRFESPEAINLSKHTIHSLYPYDYSPRNFHGTVFKCVQKFLNQPCSQLRSSNSPNLRNTSPAFPSKEVCMVLLIIYVVENSRVKSHIEHSVEFCHTIVSPNAVTLSPFSYSVAVRTKQITLS